MLSLTHLGSAFKTTISQASNTAVTLSPLTQENLFLWCSILFPASPNSVHRGKISALAILVTHLEICALYHVVLSRFQWLSEEASCVSQLTTWMDDTRNRDERQKREALRSSEWSCLSCTAFLNATHITMRNSSDRKPKQTHPVGFLTVYWFWGDIHTEVW